MDEKQQLATGKLVIQ